MFIFSAAAVLGDSFTTFCLHSSYVSFTLLKTEVLSMM